MPGEGGVELADVGVVQAAPDHRCLEIVMADDLDHAPKREEGVLMGAQEAAPVLAPQRLLVPVPAAAQRHPEDPGSPPLPGHRVQHQGRALEVVHLGLLPRRVLHDVHDLGPTAPDPPHEPLHREVPVGEAVLLAEVLPDPLSGQTPLHPSLDHHSERLAGAGRTRPRAGDRVWPLLLPENPSSASLIPGAGDRVGRFCRPPRVVSRRSSPAGSRSPSRSAGNSSPDSSRARTRCLSGTFR